MSDEDNDRDAILKELHQSSDESGGSDEDLDLGIAQLKASKAAAEVDATAKAKVSAQTKDPETAASEAIDPLKDQEQRHKANLMGDLYAEMSDEEEEDEETTRPNVGSSSEKGDTAANPFQEQIIKEALEMKQR